MLTQQEELSTDDALTSWSWDGLKQYIPFYDAYQLWRSSDYILSEGYKRSKATGVGILDPLPFGSILRSIPVVSWAASFMPRIYVFSATKNNLAYVAEYGEHIVDERAREPHSRVEKATGVKTIVNQVGVGAVNEKRKIAKNLMQGNNLDDAFSYARELGANISELWDDDICYQDNIAYVGAKIIGTCFLGVNEIPREYIPLLRKANDLIADGEATSKEFEEMSRKMLAMSDDVLGNNPQEIIAEDRYVRAQIELSGDETPEQKAELLKASHGGAGFIVESNLSFLIMSALAHISASPEILYKLKEEIDTHDITSKNDLKNFVYLDCIYRETLRLDSGTAVVPRVASVNSVMEVENRQGEKTACSIYPNSYMFFAIRATHHDPELWTNPEVFDPSRFMRQAEANDIHFIGENYFPFSAGKRACPAGNGFVEYAFKGFLIEFFKHHVVKLDKPLEDIPSYALHPRWKQDYFATLEPASMLQNTVRPKSTT